MNIFTYLNYTLVIKYFIKLNHKTYGYKAQLAEAAGCQRSYISHVLAEKTHLTLDQGLGLCRFWNLSPAEKDYFLNLVLYARAGTKGLKDHIKEKLYSAKRDQENLSKRIEEKLILPETDAAVFYSNWQYLAISIVITIPQFRSVMSISQRLNLSETVVQKSLEKLGELGLAVRSGQEWLPTQLNIHVPKYSQFNSLNHSHWRNKAVQNSFLSQDEDIHYTSVCSVSLADAEKIRQMVFSFIDESRKVVSPSKEEELFCLTCDWFKV